MFYSPLRYPGGKTKLEPLMETTIKKIGLVKGTYIEPFAGGAGIAIELLEKNIVNQIVINDLDKGIYSFWRAILTETDRFIENIRRVPLTITEWKKQREICLNNALFKISADFCLNFRKCHSDIQNMHHIKILAEAAYRYSM